MAPASAGAAACTGPAKDPLNLGGPDACSACLGAFGVRQTNSYSLTCKESEDELPVRS
jgi:hypothetical protein